jgi:leucyl aminopeptidase (aminopeptidase T)
MSPAIPEARADLLARRVLVQRLGLRPKENVTIEAFSSSLPWANGFVREARRLGARPLLHFEDEESWWRSIDERRPDALGQPGEHEWAALKESDVYVYFWGPENMARVQRSDDATFGRAQSFNAKWYETAGKAGVRGVRMGIARVTDANARFWGVSAGAWMREVFDASVRDPSPIVRDAARLQKVLEKGRSIRLRHPNGTDLTLALVGRQPRVGTGVVTAGGRKTPFGFMQSVPDANVYVAVDEGTAEGRLVSNRTGSGFGAPVRGGRLDFSNGRLTRFTAQAGANLFRAGYRSGSAGRDRPALIEVGLDPGIRFAPGLEESERGAVTVGVGRNVGYGGKNSSSFHGFLTVGGAELRVDDRPVVRGGRLL